MFASDFCMRPLLRFLVTTAVVVCHLVFTVGAWAGSYPSGSSPAATSTQAATPTPSEGGQRQSVSLARPGARVATQGLGRLKQSATEPSNVTLQARTLEAKGKLYVATGDVEIHYGDIRLMADHMTYNAQTGVATADGHVAFDSLIESTHIEGTRGWYNFTSETGEFDHFRGVSGIRLNARQAMLVSSNPLIFQGEKMQRLGPSHYRIEHGSVTSCAMPNPKWTIAAARVDVTLGEDARLYHAVFRLFDVPLFYAPFLTHSTQRTGRHSGFLLPEFGHSTSKGTVLGDSFYWAPTRNLGVTLGGQYFSARGWGEQADVEAYPTRRSHVLFHIDSVTDRGLASNSGPSVKQGGQEFNLVATHDDIAGFRAVIDANYLSSLTYRLAWKNTFAEAINSEVISTAFTERQWNGYDFSVSMHRYQNFLSTTPGDTLVLNTLPSVDFNSYDRPINWSMLRRVPVYFSWDLNLSALDRSEPGFSTGAMSRLDLGPTLTLPLQTLAGVITATVSGRSTYYSEHLENGQLANASSTISPVLARLQGITRNSGTVDLDWRPPALERIFSTPNGWFGDRLKHVFEPDIAFHYTGGVHNANDIIRYDERDILTDTRELDYGFTNRLYVGGATPGQARELASWTLEQKYFFDPTFGGALTPGARNVFQTTEMLSPFAFEALGNKFSPISSILRVSPFRAFDGDWRLDYDTTHSRVIASAFTGDFHVDNVFFSGTQFLIHPPYGLNPIPNQSNLFNQFRLAAGYGNPEKQGLSIGAAVAYDARQHFLQYTTIQTAYNWDCFGLSFQYRRFSLASVRRENQFRISFTLANVGTFGNLKRQERIF